METQELISLLRKDIREWNKWRLRKENDALNFLQAFPTNRGVLWEEGEFMELLEVNLKGANLQGLDLRGAMLGASHRLMHALEQRGHDTGRHSELQYFIVLLEKADLSNADLREADLNMALLSKANLYKADLRGADLRRAILKGAKLEHTDLRGADLSEANLEEARILHARFNDADLSRASLRNAKLFGLPAWMVGLPKFRKADGSPGGISKTHFSGAKLNEVDFSGANLSGLDLQGIDFSKTKSLSRAEFEKADLSRTNLRDTDLREANLRQANLTEADLRGAQLNAADLRGANLNRAKLSRVDLSWMDLTDTNLSEVDFTKANLAGINLTKKNLRGAILSEADLSYTMLVETDFTEANLKGCRIYGVSVWDVKLEKANQKNLVITSPQKPTITVDDLEVAQFVYLLLKYEKLRNVIEEINSKAILILGRFSPPERKSVLDALTDQLREFGFLPIVFDFERPTDKDFTETIMTLAGMVLFVIADITKPKSSPLELQAAVPDYQIPFVPIIQKGEDPFSMLANLQSKYDWVLDTFEYKNENELLELLEVAVINRALKKQSELRAKKAKNAKVLTAKDFRS